MSAFDSGFNMGMRAFQQAIENKQREEELGWKRADRARVEADRMREDEAWQNIERPPGAVAPAAPVDANISGAAMAAGGLSSSNVAPVAAESGAQTLVQPTAPAGNASVAPLIASQGLVPTVRPPESRAGQLRALEGLAIARRDASGLERLGAARQAADEDAFVAQALKSYTGAEDQIGATAQHLNSVSKSIAMSDPDKHGVVRVSVVTPDRRAQFLDLSRQDQARLYAAAQLMERNPAKAYEMMSGVNKVLADAVKTESDMMFGASKVNNDAAFKERDDVRADRQLAETGRHNLASESIAAAKGVASAGGVNREERMRYTSLLGETSRRLTETQKALATLQKDPLYAMAKPGSPQQIELQGLRDNIAALSDERKTYQGLLSASQAANPPAAAAAGGGAVSSGGKPSWQSGEAHSDQVMIIQRELEKAQASGRAEDATALQRELKRLGVEPGKVAAQIGAPAKGAVLQKLPEGAKQIGTSGGRPVYELPDGRRVY